MTHKSAFISIVGRPNTGKSTLLNALVGEKVAITSHHPNTTRRAIRGIVTGEDYQLVFVDTPGLHKPKTALGGALNTVVSESLDDVDVIIQCIPVNSPVGIGDEHVAREIARHKGSKKFAVVTMMDRRDSSSAPKQLMAVSDLARNSGFEWDEIVPISAMKSEGIALLTELLAKSAPEGPKFYPDEMTSDQELDLVLADLIRESAIREMKEEIPHSVAVTIDDIATRPEGNFVDIHASIVVERESQKSIIIGRNGASLKEIGSRARSEIEAKLGKRVFLGLQVKVMANWQRDTKALSKLGITTR